MDDDCFVEPRRKDKHSRIDHISTHRNKWGRTAYSPNSKKKTLRSHRGGIRKDSGYETTTE